MVHGVVEGRSTGSQHPQPFGLLRREAAPREPGSGSLRFEIPLRPGLRGEIRGGGAVGVGVNVVGIGGPAEEGS